MQLLLEKTSASDMNRYYTCYVTWLSAPQRKFANLFGTESASRVRTEIQLLCMTCDCHEVKAKHGYTAECRVR